MNKRDALITVVTHVLETLPDRLAKRRETLTAVVSLLPLNNEVRTRAAILLTQLERHEQTVRELQAELPLIFSELND
ncbi:MAG: hypothetical protein AB9869_01170 [Verrucomicrobiia bacterium]